MNELALFAGAGGGILGGKLLGWRTVCAVEFDPYARDVLVARQNDGSLEPFPIWDDVRTFDGHPWRGRVDVVSGGFPCQDISCAGKGAGLEGARSGLWGQMARIIGEVRPRYVFVENSPVLTSRGLGVVLGDLASMGFDARWGVLGADDAGAPHRRKRIWIVANTRSRRLGEQGARQVQQQGGAEAVRASALPHPDCFGGREAEKREPWGCNPSEPRADGEAESVAHANGHGSSRHERGRCGARTAEGPTGEACGTGTLRHPDRDSQPAMPVDASVANPASLRGYGRENHARCSRESAGSLSEPRDSGGKARSRCSWWLSEPDVGRVADDVAARVDRLRCLGNGQVPACVVLAWRTLT